MKTETNFKQTEVGTFPKDWDIVTINDVIENIKRGPFGGSIKKEIFVKQGYKIYEQKNVIKNNFELGSYYIDENKFNELKSFSIQKDDVLLTAAGTIGKFAIVPENFQPGIINQALIKITLCKEKIDVIYFVNLLQHKIFKKLIQEKSHGATMKNISSIKELKSIKIPLPSIKEQQKIADVLSIAVSIINQYDVIIQKTQLLKNGIMQKLFKNGINHNKFKETDIGKIPKEWEVQRLGNVIELIMGQAPPGNSYNTNGVGTVLVKVGEFGEIFPEKKVWTNNPLKFAKSNDVLLCVVGATIGKINLGINCAVGRSVAALRPDQSKILQKYLYYYLEKQIFFIRTLQHGTAQGVLSKSDINGLLIPLPSIKEQQKIIEIFSTCDEKLQIEIKKREHFVNLKKGLMTELLIGQRRFYQGGN